MRAEGRLALRLALAHHPLCHWFRSDRLGGLCSGCIVFWPAVAATVPAAITALARGADPAALLAAGVVLGLPHLLTLRWRDRLARAAIKAMGGSGVAAAGISVFVLPVAWSVRLGLFAGGLSLFGLWLALRARSMLKVCDACPWQRDWANCPGFPLSSNPGDPQAASAAPARPRVRDRAEARRADPAGAA